MCPSKPVVDPVTVDLVSKAQGIMASGNWPMVYTLLKSLYEGHQDSGYCQACLHHEHLEVCPLHEDWKPEQRL